MSDPEKQEKKIEKLAAKVCNIFGGSKLFSEWDMKASA